MTISQEVPQPSITKISLKIISLKFRLHLSGSNGLNAYIFSAFVITMYCAIWNCITSGYNETWLNLYIDTNDISLKYDPCGLIDNMTSLVQIMAWQRIGAKPLSDTMLTQFTKCTWPQ